MALPGLGLVDPTATAAVPITQSTTVVHDLRSNCEWRFEVATGSEVKVKVLQGTAELFGTELALNHTYTFRNTKAAIFTWHGCRLEVTGPCEEYMAEETPMTLYANTHFALENLREQASQHHKDGPRVMVVGPSNSGKTSLVKLLTAYATRRGWQPMVVNTDTRESLLSVPGTVTATAFASLMDIEEGWGSSPTSGPSPVPVKFPICYYYGLPSPEDNTKLLKPLLSRLALAVTSRMADDEEVKKAGMIIDTSGIVSQGKGGYEILAHIVAEFSVDVIFVLGSERLHSDMVRRFSSKMSVIRLQKSGGCVDRDEGYMELSRQAAVKEYFFGDPKLTLSPHTQQVDFSSLSIFRLKDPRASFEQEDDPYSDAYYDASLSSASQIYEKVEPTSSMLNCVLAVMYASPLDPQDAIRDASVMGFVYVADVDDKRKKVKLLTPLSGKIGDRPLVWGSFPEAVSSIM